MPLITTATATATTTRVVTVYARMLHKPHPLALSLPLALATLIGSGGEALAQQPASGAPAMSTPAKPVFSIRGFDISGDNPLPAGESTRILAPFLRSDASMETLQKATTALEEALKARGYALHRVVLPPQEVGETVRLNIVKFVLGKVSVEGLKDYSEANIRASLPELQEGTAPNFRTLAVQTAIANESAGKQVQIALKEAEAADQIDARVVVTESKPWNFALSLANTGSRASGRDRLTFSGSHANVLDLDHQFTGAYTTSIEKTSDVQQLGLNYKAPLYRLGGVAAASFPLQGGGRLRRLPEHRCRPDPGHQLQPVPAAGRWLPQLRNAGAG